MKNEHVNDWTNISILTDNIKLTNEQIIICLNRNNLISGKKSIFKLILKGYIFAVFSAVIRSLFNLKRTNKWNILLNIPLRNILISKGIKVECESIKIIDKTNNIKMEFHNKEGKYWWRTWNLLTSYNDSIVANQYNVSKENIQNKIVIDAGSDLGEFALYCARLGAKKVYAFEPVKETCDIIKKQVEMNKLEDKIIIVNSALGDKNEKLYINYEGEGDSAARFWGKSNVNSILVNVVKLDDFIQNVKIGFIKMDVEGFEENVLNGSKLIIKRNKPILSFSAYHKPTDKKRLPMIVREIRSDYKIKLLKRSEEDFYCE